MWTGIAQTLVWWSAFKDSMTLSLREVRKQKGDVQGSNGKMEEKKEETVTQKEERIRKGEYRENIGTEHVQRILKQAFKSYIRLFSKCWLVGYHDNPSLELSGDEVQYAEKEKSQRKMQHTLSVYQYLPVSFYLCLSQFSSDWICVTSRKESTAHYDVHANNGKRHLITINNKC